ncbi:MAG: YbaY family lipoprotein [Anaerolineae bacterium]
MNRTGSLLFIAFIILMVVAAVYTTTALALRPANGARNGEMATASVQTSVTGVVAWGRLVVLAPEARISVRLLDVSNASGGEVVLGSYVLIVADGGYPATFEIPYDPSTIRPGGLYAVVGDIVADDTLLFRSNVRTPVITRGSSNEVYLFLSKVGPWSPFEMAVSSGQLARFSY